MISRSKLISDKVKNKMFTKIRNQNIKVSIDCSCGQDGNGLIGKAYFGKVIYTPNLSDGSEARKKNLDILKNCEQGLYNLDTETPEINKIEDFPQIQNDWQTIKPNPLTFILPKNGNCEG